MMSQILKINVKRPWEISKGHNSHRGGAGCHQDRRTKRCRTRSEQNRKAIKEHE